ncbi:PREDICTED: ras-related protein RABG3c-like isoform X2 [Brassica oleracea var. oleracea]|uniref:ras-related protein RABG3c-like isoform X2 n=1 Tax=Brassica oleracea var. oleracea TaxID=109376 RepID=UPI0006A73210|nr:PREDICTED: ras-related protein RABG3c-like isoform X2 [Brassica oleracea var. oleracea]
MVLPILVVGDRGFVNRELTAKIDGALVRRMNIDDQISKLKICEDNLCPYPRDRICCCVLVFDVNDRASFDSLNKHIDQFVFEALPDAYKFKYVVLGNKVDIQRPRAVTESEAREWCYLNRDALYFETSAVEENSVEVVLLQIARCAIGYAPHAPAPLFNLQDVVLENDLSHLSVVFFLSRERMLKASEVHLIQDHLLFLYVYKSTTPKLTPGLFLTKRKYWNKDVADIMHGHNWETITESTVYSQLEIDDSRGPVEVSFASWRRDNDSPRMDRYIYLLADANRNNDMCLVHYMSR